MNPLQIQFMLGRFKVTAETGAVETSTPFVANLLGATAVGLAGFLLGKEAGAKKPELFALGGAVVGWFIGGIVGLQVKVTA